MSTNFLKAGVLALSLVLAACGNDDDNGGGITALGDRDWGDFGREGEITLGDADAPVSIIEYASVTCSHCASFHIFTYPSMKEHYIDTGLVRYTIRPLPTPPMTMARLGFMTARCVSDDRYYAFIDALMRTQNTWAFNPDADTRLNNLGQLARQAGLSQEQFDACRLDQEMLDWVNESAEEATSLGVNTTPTFFINGEMINGARNWADFEPLILRQLPEELHPVADMPADEEG